MEEDEEEKGDDDNIIIRGFAEYGAFDDTTMGEAEEEVVAEDEPTDDLGQAIRDAHRESKEWCIRQGILGVTDYRKEDASEGK